jgi:hypothetical protein
MRLDGKSVTATINSAGPTSMTKSVAQRVFLIDPNSPDLRPLPNRLSSGEATYSYPFKTLEVGGLTVNNPAIEIYDGGAGPECDGRTHNVNSEKVFVCYGGADIHVGLSILRKLHLYFAFGEKTLYATAADLTADSAAAPGTPAARE